MYTEILKLAKKKIEEYEGTWSKPISLSKAWTLNISVRFPNKSMLPAGGDLGLTGFAPTEDSLEPSIKKNT